MAKRYPQEFRDDVDLYLESMATSLETKSSDAPTKIRPPANGTLRTSAVGYDKSQVERFLHAVQLEVDSRESM
jgi:hypothetical protein